MTIIEAQEVLKMRYPATKAEAEAYYKKIASAMQVFLDAGICPNCQSTNKVERRRRRTAYQDDNANHIISCLECYKEDNLYWDERWADYYSGLM